jgi:EmrB/QacA subfamily drug resistance transporter
MAEPDPRRWKALAVCLAAGFIVLLDVSIVNVALPSIRTGLHASASELQWVLSGYSLTFGLMLVPAGRIGDMRGRRGMFIIALSAFIAASAACGAATGSTWLVVARLIQGLAGGCLTPQVSAMIQELFSGRERGRAFGLFGSVVGVSTAIGPLLGGLLIAAFGTSEGWRAVFLVNVPIGLALIPFAWRLLGGLGGHAARHDFDPVGIVLLGVAAVTLLLPFVEARQWGSWKWVLLPVAAVLVVAFVTWERRYHRSGREPVVDLGLFRRRSYSTGISMILLYFAAFTPVFFVFTLFLQSGLDDSALVAGLSITPFAVGSAITAGVGGRAVIRLGRPLIAVGLVTVAVGLAGSVLAVHEVPGPDAPWATLVPLLVAGLGGGLVIAPNQTLTLSEVPVAQAGTAGGLLQTSQRIGAAVGVAAVGSVFFATATGGRSGFAVAYQRSALVCVAFTLAALALTVTDLAMGRRRHPEPVGDPADQAA